MSRDVFVFALALVALVGTFALLLLGRPVPELVATLDAILVGAAAGVAVPRTRAGA